MDEKKPQTVIQRIEALEKAIDPWKDEIQHLHGDRGIPEIITEAQRINDLQIELTDAKITIDALMDRVAGRDKDISKLRMDLRYQQRLNDTNLNQLTKLRRKLKATESTVMAAHDLSDSLHQFEGKGNTIPEYVDRMWARFTVAVQKLKGLQG